MIRTPKYCLICGAPWSGGHANPLESIKPGLRQFYECGASMSVKIISEGVYQVLIKNCFSDDQNDQQIGD